MKREIGQEIVTAMEGVDSAIDRLDVAIRAIEDETERKRMLKFIALLICDLHEQITLPVVKHFPDLHPDLPKP
jgi:hypothetical protein